MTISETIGKIGGCIFGYSFRRALKAIHIQASLAAYNNYLNRKASHYGNNCRIYFPQSLRGCQYMSIGDNFKLGEGSILEAWDEHNGVKFSPRIRIGNDVSFGRLCHIGCINSISIGNGVLGGANILIVDHSHGNTKFPELEKKPNDRTLFSSGGIIIEDNVWLGDRVIVLPGVTIGENAIIGAGSVVTRSIPSGCVACGVPAKPVKYLVE